MSLTALAPNTPPAVTPPGLADVAVTEDAPNTLVDLWAAFEDAEDQDADLTYTVTGNTNAALFRAVSVDAATGKLVLNYAANASGTADLTVRATDRGTVDTPEPLFVEETFAVSVAPVNDAPSFMKGPDQFVVEDFGAQTVVGWATDISPGPADEAGQQLDFEVTADNPALFAAGPAVAPNGTLTFTPAPNAFGTAVVTVLLKDNGGTADGGDDASEPQTFEINISGVNDAPTFGSIADRVIRLSAPPQTVTITGVSAGPGESAQAVTLTASSDNPAFIPTPTITGTGSIRRLTFSPEPNVAGVAVITVTARDEQGLTLTRTFRVRVGDEAAPLGADAAEFRVNSFTTGPQRTWSSGRSVAADADGDFVVTWASLDQGDDPDWGIYAQRFNAAGVPQGDEFRVNQTKADFQQTPAVAMAPDGAFVITWQGFGTTATGWDVYARRYNADGTPAVEGAGAGGEFVVNSTVPGDQTWPAVAVAPDGDFVVAWASKGQDGGGEGVYARRFDAAGGSLGAEFRVNEHTASDQSFPAVAASSNGKFLVAWQSLFQDGSDWGVYARQYSTAGVAEGGEFLVTETTAGRQIWPSAAASGSGWVVTWSGTPDSTQDSGDVYVRLLAPAGAGVAPVGPETVANTTAASTQWHSAVASDGAGNFVVSWEGVAGSGWDTYAQRYDAEASAVGEEFKVHTAFGDQQNVGIAMDAGGNFVAAWTSIGDGSSFGVFARRFRVNPDPAVAVTGSEFLYQSVPHRLRLSFSDNVSASLAEEDLIVRNVGTGTTVTVADVTYDTSTNTAVFTFEGAVPDGNYQVTLPASSVAGPDARPMAADYRFDFFSLIGDVNRDRSVNGSDFALLAGSFGKTGMTYGQGDLNGDGAVNGSDFAILAGSFGRTVPAPAAAVTAANLSAASVSAAPTPTPASPKPAAVAASRKAAPPKKLSPRRVTPVARVSHPPRAVRVI